jgi:hypothetical protein
MQKPCRSVYRHAAARIRAGDAGGLVPTFVPTQSKDARSRHRAPRPDQESTPIMSLPMRQVCLPPLRQTLDSLSTVLAMASEHFAKAGVSEAEFLQSRLAPDMFTFAQQIHAMTDHARRVVALLAGVEMPEIPATETDIAGLRARIAQTLAFIDSVDAAAIDAGQARPLAVSNRIGVLNMEGWEYTLRVAFPHFFFHATTAYDLIRHAGVEVGKRHFLGSVFRERLTPHAKAS